MFTPHPQMARSLWAFTAVLTLAAACAAGTAADRQVRQATGSGWTLTFDMSGGIAGLDRRLTLSNTGMATVVDRRRQITRAVTVPSGDVMAIQLLLGTVRAGDTRSPACRDCIEYQLELQSNGAPTMVHTDDTGLDNNDAAPLIRALAQLTNRILSGELQ